MKGTVLALFLILTMFSCIKKDEDIFSISGSPEKAYSWLVSMQMQNGLIPSYEYPGFTEDPSYTVSLYDNALAVLAFIINEDFVLAEKVLDFFNTKLNSEFYDNGQPRGFFQFRHPETGDASDSNRWLGDNAWLLIALHHYHQSVPDPAKQSRYLTMVSALESMIVSLQDSDGGVKSGFSSSGTELTYKVVEGNLDAFNAVSGYTVFHRDLLEYLYSQRWDSADNAFVADPSSIPYRYALDNVSWGYTAIPDMPTVVLGSANLFETTKLSSYGNILIQGHCFDEDKDTVWLEGTAEMVVAYNTAYDATGNSDYSILSNFYLRELEGSFIPGVSNRQEAGLPYVVNDDSATYYGTDSLTQYIEANDESPWVSSSVWYIFAKIGFDPFDLGRQKNIPSGEHPWLP